MHVNVRGSHENRPLRSACLAPAHAARTKLEHWIPATPARPSSPRLTTGQVRSEQTRQTRSRVSPVFSQSRSLHPDLRRRSAGSAFLAARGAGPAFATHNKPNSRRHHHPTHMTRRQSTRPTAVLIGAMSFLGRCRALSATTGASVSAVVRPTAATAGAAAAQQAGRRAGMLGFLSPAAATQRYSSARWAGPSSLSLLGSLSPASCSLLSSAARPRASSRGVVVGASPASPSRRRKRTALGMVSDRPFRGPQAEVMEEMDFSGLGLLGDLVGAMDEFGEKSGFGVRVSPDAAAAAAATMMQLVVCCVCRPPHVARLHTRFFRRDNSREKGLESVLRISPWVYSTLAAGGEDCLAVSRSVIASTCVRGVLWAHVMFCGSPRSLPQYQEIAQVGTAASQHGRRSLGGLA